ncbi:MAG TPA: thioredoxin domain-containing protein [Longimicrobiales bacterium]|nr:thioredoxin domain-containing protein [Longimicrobiales bacterium]
MIDPMKRTARLATAILGVALLAGCGGGGEPDSPSTEGTTRSLLNQDIIGGPSTPVEGDSDLTSRLTRAHSIPELGHNLGSLDAPLKLMEFSDFGCGYCRRFHEESFAALQEQFVDTERIEWKFMPFITGMFDNSLAVTEAAECVREQSEDAFWAFSDRLWGGQSEWKGSSEPEAVARSWARELGVEVDRYDSCLAEDRRLERVAGATLLAQQLGIRGTPTFWLVGYGPLQGALPLEAFQGILGAVLQEVEAGQAAAADSAAVSESD